MKDVTTIEVKRDTKKRLDHIKADLQANFDTVVNKLCDCYEDKYRCEREGLKHE